MLEHLGGAEGRIHAVPPDLRYPNWVELVARDGRRWNCQIMDFDREGQRLRVRVPRKGERDVPLELFREIRRLEGPPPEADTSPRFCPR